MLDLRHKPSFVMIELNSNSQAIEQGYLRHRGLKVKSGLGSYKNKQSITHLVTFRTIEDLQKIISIAREYHQESILVVDSNRTCDLIYMDPKISPVKLGNWTEITQYEASKSDSWTLLDNRYFVAS